MRRIFKDAQLHDRQPIIARALAGQTVRHERRILRNAQTGAVHDLLVSANPVFDDHGQPIAALVIARDVSELSQLQQRVGDIERHRAIGQMAAALAHDFNNILDTIGQAAAVLQMNQDRPAAERKPLDDTGGRYLRLSGNGPGRSGYPASHRIRTRPHQERRKLC